ncbi:MAG: DUF4436 family protein [Mycolicibacterium neoaurum]|uniref:DUF4436 family protein n=1 Tax=Mycolicibacterium neoaurum TaxID=1795 RepID=UPI002FF785C8
MKSTAGRLDRGARILVVLVVIGIVMACSVGGFLASRSYTQQSSVPFGTEDADSPDVVLMSMYITRVDVHDQSMTVELDVNDDPVGGVSDGLTEDITVETNSRRSSVVKFSEGDRFHTVIQEFALGGSSTDFPFDTYQSFPAIQVLGADGAPLPLEVTLSNGDAFFAVTPALSPDQGWLSLTLKAERSVPTMVFGVFIMVLMLGLAASAAVLASYVVRTRRGVEYGAYSVMAALLFAMVPLRNAIPGDPPIGSLIDFSAFFIAEAVIAVSLITSVVVGYRNQLSVDSR